MAAVTTERQVPQLTSQNWAGHWHGFGPWAGTCAQYHEEGNRRPPHPDPPHPAVDQDIQDRYGAASSAFYHSKLPPNMTGHWLVKKGAAGATADRTWADFHDAVQWLKQRYTDSPPYERADGLQAYIPLDDRMAGAYDALPRGVDVTWCYYTQSSGGQSLMSMSVVCCPNRFHPDIACPLPPRR